MKKLLQKIRALFCKPKKQEADIKQLETMLAEIRAEIKRVDSDHDKW